jgi:hypothetical protein
MKHVQGNAQMGPKKMLFIKSGFATTLYSTKDHCFHSGKPVKYMPNLFTTSG